MHIVTSVKHVESYKLAITFEDGTTKIIDLSTYLNKGVFKPLKKLSYFKTVRLDSDLDTIVWDNGADISPDFLYEIGVDIAVNKKTPSKDLSKKHKRTSTKTFLIK